MTSLNKGGRMLEFNINIKEDSWHNSFKEKLKMVKEDMEKNPDAYYYLNIHYGKNDFDRIDLKKMATVEICFDGLVIYSGQSFDVMIIPWRSIRNIDFIEWRSK